MSSPAKFDVAIFKGKVIHDQVMREPQACIDLVKKAYLAHADGQSVNPDSYFLRFPHRPTSRIIALPAWLGRGFDIAGLKWIASFPENVQRGFPRASATLILNDDATGYPVAILESSIISAARTAASAVLGAELLRGKREAGTLGVVGCGLISRYVYDFLARTGWRIDAVQTFDTSPGEAERFNRASVKAEAHRAVTVAPALEALRNSTDLVLFATTAPTPHVTEPSWFSHRPTVLHLSLRDLSPQVVLSAFNVTDDVEHVMKAGTSLHLTEQREGNRRFVAGTVAELVRGKITPDPKRASVFSPFGMGILDLALGKWVLDTCRDRALVLDDFFYDLTR